MPDLYLPPLCTIHPGSVESLGPQIKAWSLTLASLTPTISSALCIPFVLRVPITVQQLWIYNGASVAGSIDLGVYSGDGVRLVRTGFLAQAGTSAIQAIALSSPLRMPPGKFYLAIATTNTAGFSVFSWNTNASAFLGQVQSSVGVTVAGLPATMTFSHGASVIPLFGLSTRSLI